MPAEEAFKVISDSGYKRVDVHEKVHLQIFPDLCDPVALKEIAETNGLKIANLATYAGGGVDGRRKAYALEGWEVPNPERFTEYGFSSDEPQEQKKELEQLMRTIDLAVFFGARSIRVIPGNDQPVTIDKIVPWFKRAAEYAAEKNVYMSFENGFTDLAGTPECCVELVEKVGSPYFGIMYEPGNLLHDTGADYLEALKIMKDHIIHCHFKDCKPVGDGYEFQHYGKGVIDFPCIMDSLYEYGYKGQIALEYELPTPKAEIDLRKYYEDFAALFTRDRILRKKWEIRQEGIVHL
jgi:sugar phosphate isomerase/epimerase